MPKMQDTLPGCLAGEKLDSLSCHGYIGSPNLLLLTSLIIAQ